MSFWRNNVIILFTAVTSQPPTVPRHRQARTTVIHEKNNGSKKGGTLHSRPPAKKERWVAPGQGQIPGKQTGTMQLS